MKRLLNDLMINDTRWPVNKKVKQETNLWSDSIMDCICWSNIFFPYRHRILNDSMALPTMVLPMRVRPSVFSSRNLLGLLRLLNKCMIDQFRMALAKRQMSLSTSIINPANKNGCDAWGSFLCSARDHFPCGAHWAYKICSIVDVHRSYKAVTSFWVNIKPMKPTISISRAHQVYKVSQDHQEIAAHLTAWYQ